MNPDRFWSLFNLLFCFRFCKSWTIWSCIVLNQIQFRLAILFHSISHKFDFVFLAWHIIGHVMNLIYQMGNLRLNYHWCYYHLGELMPLLYLFIFITFIGCFKLSSLFLFRLFNFLICDFPSFWYFGFGELIWTLKTEATMPLIVSLWRHCFWILVINTNRMLRLSNCIRTEIDF